VVALHGAGLQRSLIHIKNIVDPHQLLKKISSVPGKISRDFPGRGLEIVKPKTVEMVHTGGEDDIHVGSREVVGSDISSPEYEKSRSLLEESGGNIEDRVSSHRSERLILLGR
jgi:hypothetical protein